VATAAQVDPFRERKTAERRRPISTKISQTGCVTRQDQPDRNQQKQSEKTVETKPSSEKQFPVQENSRSTNGRGTEKRRDFVEPPLLIESVQRAPY